MWRKRGSNVDHDGEASDLHFFMMMTSMMIMMMMMMMMMAVALMRGQLLCHPLPIIGEINRYTGGGAHTQSIDTAIQPYSDTQ